MALPFTNQMDLQVSNVRIEYEAQHWDDTGHEQTQRRTGALQCPCCSLWWPIIEEPEEWTENDETGRWDALAWWGGVVCGECNLLMAEMPDGRVECYKLSNDVVHLRRINNQCGDVR